MRYAKLIDGYPQYAPNPIHYDRIWRCNPPDSVYLEQGYKPVTESPFPDTDAQPGFRWQMRWEETDEAIIQTWEQLAIPPDEALSPEETLDILLGGEGQ